MSLYFKHDDETIGGFFGRYRFLSNFHIVPILFDGRVYLSVENAYQAAKFPIDHPNRDILLRVLPGKAKRIGKSANKDLPQGWHEGLKYDRMLEFTRQKYKPKTYLREQLIKTNPKQLIEMNTWGDTYWGVCKDEGQNTLGQILMKVRQEAMT